MKTLILAALLAISGIASAATYNLTVQGQDPVAVGPSYSPAPKVWYRVGPSGAWVAVPNAAVADGLLHASAQVSANPADAVYVKGQSCNGVDNSCAAEQVLAPLYAPTDAQPFTGFGAVLSR